VAITKKEPCVNTAPSKEDVSALFGIGQVSVLTLCTASSPVKAAEGLPVGLGPTATRLFDALQQVAELAKIERGYHSKTSQVTFFAPVDSVALAIGVSRQTVYNRLPELVLRGLVEQTGHFCTHNGSTRSDGSLWAVKLDLETTGKAKIDYDWLKGSYRSLGDDIATGRTAWAALQSNPRRKNSVDISYITTFALSPTKQPLGNDCKAADTPALESLLDVAYAPLEGRNDAVNIAAKAISTTLGGVKRDLNLYRWLVWALLRLEQQHQKTYYYQVFLMVQRCGVEKRENACKNPTGLLVSRLKAAGIWQELKNCKQSRIGTVFKA
jgi:hypothetical protein